MNQLCARIKALAGHSTADLIGIAPGDAFSAEELGDLGAAFGPVRAVVVLAQRIVDPVQLVRFRDGAEYRESGISNSYADALLRDACWRVVELLRESRYRAAIPRNLRYGADEPRHDLSFKKAGVLAGLGSFGKNQLLIHPEWGPWMMLRAVITDAPLPADERSTSSPCDDCGRCLTVCPSGALTTAGIDRDICSRSCGYGGGPNSWVVRLSEHGQINCVECLRACPVGEAPPRMQL